MSTKQLMSDLVRTLAHHSQKYGLEVHLFSKEGVNPLLAETIIGKPLSYVTEGSLAAEGELPLNMATRFRIGEFSFELDQVLFINADIRTQQASIIISTQVSEGAEPFAVEQEIFSKHANKLRKALDKFPSEAEPPDLETLRAWESEGGCEATDGCWVEPDGTCPHGHPSWLLKLGYI